MTMTQKTYSYRNISTAGQGWIRDLMGYAEETGFPEIDNLCEMTEEERDILSSYLREDDGSLDEETMEFSVRVADEIDGLEGDE